MLTFFFATPLLGVSSLKPIYSSGCYSQKKSLPIPILTVGRLSKTADFYEKSPTSVVSEVTLVLMAVILAYPVATGAFTSLQSLLVCQNTVVLSSEGKLSRGKPKATCLGQGVCCEVSQCVLVE